MNVQQLLDQACPDCPADVATRTDVGLTGDVLVVLVTHQPTCPWFAVYGREGATLATEFGIVMHAVSGAP